MQAQGAWMAQQPRRALTPLERRRLMGRRVGIAIFSAIFAGATLIWTVQILSAVWGSAPPSPAGCARGTQSLEQALDRTDEWTLQHNQVTQPMSGFTAAKAKADYAAARDRVRALNAEDSGSTYFWKMPRGATSAMGAAAR